MRSSALYCLRFGASVEANMLFELLNENGSIELDRVTERFDDLAVFLPFCCLTAHVGSGVFLLAITLDGVWWPASSNR